MLSRSFSALLLLCSLTAPAATLVSQVPAAPLTLLSQTYLPDITGDFDHFAYDLKRNHLFVSAEEHHSVEMFDLETGKHLQSITGFKTPHSLAFAAEKDELLVCDGGDSALLLLSGASLQRTGRTALIDGSATGAGDSPDAAYYDAANRLYYIGNGGASAKQPTSRISIFSVDQGKLIGDFDVAGNNVEAIGIDHQRGRLYVNIRDQKQVGVYDLATRKLLTTWTAPGMNRNTSLLVDQESARIFVAGRSPGMLYVFDSNGKVIAQLPCTERNDEMNWDPATHLLYVSGTQGLSVFHQDTPDTYTEFTRIPTNGAKTGVLVRDKGLLFLVHPKTDVDVAGLLVYRIDR
ncbi:MAG: YncE family protein [Janthinobacterium lividum]